jgi:hypothetical protein
MDSSCTIYDIGEMPVEGGGGQRFIAMEFLDGQTLERHISGKPLPLDETLELAIEIADRMVKNLKRIEKARLPVS